MAALGCVDRMFLVNNGTHFDHHLKHPVLASQPAGAMTQGGSQQWQEAELIDQHIKLSVLTVPS